MGIFDFARNVGAKIFGTKPPEASEANPDKWVPLAKHVENHGINPKDISFRFENGVLIVEGYVPTQEIREKVILIVGNVKDIGEVDDRLHVGVKPVEAPRAPGGIVGAVGTVAASSAAATSSPWASKTYTVVSGDTLSAIAKKMYGSAAKYPQIFEANKPMLKDPDEIYPGQVLRIPPEA